MAGETPFGPMETWEGSKIFVSFMGNETFQDLACFSKRAHYIRVAFPVPEGGGEGGNSQDQEM